MTDAEGKFAFHGLDPELLFQLLAVAEDRTPTFSGKYVDPQLGEYEMELESSDLDERPRELVLRGRVVDAHGDPIPKAALYPQGFKLKDGGVQCGGAPTDPLAITNAKGEFRLGVDEPGLELYLQVSARSYAARMTPFLAAGTKDNVITLVRGTTVTGRVERDKKPLAGLMLGIVQQDRDNQSWLGERTIGTDASGRFTFVNVPAGEAHALYGKSESCKELGAISVRVLTTGAEETTLDVGVLALEPGCRVSGRVVTTDGQKLPEKASFMLSREEAFDAMFATLGASGEFVFEHVPSDLCNLVLKVPGYRFSARNPSLDFLNPSGLLGRAEGEALELVFELEPGDSSFVSEAPGEEMWKRYQALLTSPLRGIPASEIPAAQPR